MAEYGELVSAREIHIREMNSMRGRVLSAIESTALPTDQKRALVTMFKHLTYQSQGVIAELLEKLDTEGRMFRYRQERLDEERV